MAKKLCKQIDLGIDPMTGKRVRKRIYGTSKTDLERNIKQAVADFTLYGSPSELTLGQFKEKYFDAYLAQYEANTRRHYKYYFSKTKHLDNTKMSRITHTDLQKVISDMWQHPNSANRVAGTLNKLWTAAVNDHVVQKNVACDLNTPVYIEQYGRACTEAEKKAVKEVELEPDDRLLVNILRQFGLRPQEALALQLKDFNRKDKTLNINKALSYEGQAPIIKSTKTHVSRKLPVPDEFFDLLPTGRLYLFVNESGELHRKNQFDQVRRRILDAINVQLGGNENLKVTDMTLYTLRHTKATELYYMPGISTKQKAAYLGHSEEEFLKRYSHLDENKEATEVLRTLAI